MMMKPLAWKLAVVALCLSVRTARPAEPPVSSQIIVPVVGSVEGPGLVHWQTDFAVHNDLRSPVDVALTLPTVGDQYLLAFTLQPGQTVRYPDLMGEVFNLAGVLAPLSITMSSPRPLPVQTTVWGLKADHPPTAQFIPPIYTMPALPLRVLSGLSFSDQFRTNVGLGNVGAKAALFVLALRRVEGRDVAVRSFMIPPNTLWQIPIHVLFPVITDGNNFTIVAEASGPDTYVYASVIDNATNEARFVQPGVGVPRPELTTGVPRSVR
jgi:hypothetical protein